MRKVAVLLSVLFVLAGFARLDAAINLINISTPFPTPIGIDHSDFFNEVIMSVNYSGGQPNNLVRVAANGTQTAFSSVSGFTDEVKIATVRSGGMGGFVPGELFVGNGVDGQIVKISPDGSTVLNPWVSLPGAGNGLMRGSLYVDRTTVFGGDLIAVTTGGEVWRINSAGTPTFIADVNTHLEGLTTVPNNPAQYGPLAGKILAGAENQSLMYAFDTLGNVATYSLGVDIEDIDLIPANENFFGVNFGTGQLLGAAAADFSGMVGDILLTQEFGGGVSGLFSLSWNGTNLVTQPLALDPGSAIPGQWEHVTFSPAGIVEIPPTNPTVPEPISVIVWSLLGCIGLTIAWRRRK